MLSVFFSIFCCDREEQFWSKDFLQHNTAVLSDVPLKEFTTWQE